MLYIYYMRWLKLFEDFKKIKDITIIGGGISSLYAAYLLKKKFPEIKYTIIEMDSECGGRVKMSKINGVKLPTGAHFSRLSKDKILSKLLKDLDIKIAPYELKIDYAFEQSDINKLISKLIKSVSKFDRSKFTFKEFAKEVLKDDYDNFINMMGYTDFENYDFKDAVLNYGLDDNIPGYKIADIPWDELVLKLIDFIGNENIVLNTEVKSIKKEGSKYLINSKWKSDGVIIGVTVNQLRKLLDNKIYDGIESQNLIKIFAQTNLDIDNYTVVDSELRKVIPIDKDVYTVAFSDNKDSKDLKDKDKGYIENLLSKHFKKLIKLKNVKKFFWEEGTHYFKPLSKKWKNRRDFIYESQHPKSNIWVIGEMVAEKQGWVEGALSSVENISLFK